MEREQAARALEVVGGAKRRVRRHGPNNGVVPLVWGAIMLVGLPLFDLPGGAFRGVSFGVLAGLGGAWTALYGGRLAAAGVAPSRAAIREYAALLLGWLAYYVAMLVAWVAFVVGRLPYAWTILAPLVAAPLLIGGWRMWRRARG